MRRVPRKDASLWVSPHHHDLRIALLQESPGSGDRAAGAEPGDEMRNPALGRLPDLGAGGAVVRLGVGGVRVLVRLPGTGDLASQPIAYPVVAALVVGVDVSGADHQLGPVGAKQRPLLLRLLVGHDEDAPVAANRCGHRQTDPGIAAGRLHDRAAWLEEACTLGGLDHR